MLTFTVVDTNTLLLGKALITAPIKYTLALDLTTTHVQGSVRVPFLTWAGL